VIEIDPENLTFPFLRAPMKDTDDVQKLIRLKRYETPGEEYFEKFAEEFKDRQRSEMLQRSSRSILAERVSLWFDELHGSKWLIPTGAAAAAIGAGIFLTSTGANENESVESTMAEASAVQSELPPFPESTDEIIRLQIPKSGMSGEFRTGQVLPASVRGSLREL
jgi:hypothetical protein